LSDEDYGSEHASDSDLEPFMPADHLQCVFDRRCIAVQSS
jgi:hypothetical protein